MTTTTEVLPEAAAQRDARRSFIGGLWHGAFLSMGMALTQPTTVLAAFVAALTGSTVWVGGLSTVLTVAGVLPQLFIARYIEPRPRKMPYLLLAIYLRVVSWGLLAVLVHLIGETRPELLAWVLVGLLAVFYAGGGLGGVPYNDIIGKVIPLNRRGAFFGGKELLAGPLSVGAALLAKHILGAVPYPDNYALLFGLAAAGLGIAAFGFWIVREPPGPVSGRRPVPWRAYFAHLLSAGRQLRALVIVQLLTGFSLMAMPFYVVYARERLGAPAEAVGWYLLAQVVGGMVATALWARLVDRASSRAMLGVCAALAAITPLVALGLGTLWGWPALLAAFFLIGAITNGRKVGFSAALLELAPAAERPTYTALNAVLTLPVALLPLLAGLLLQHWEYSALFWLVSGFVALGALWTLRLPARNQQDASGL
ncbi:MAG: MFS transporter [Anaerolineae bacterium]|nr:MFS transporter [Anaerolineae bacterium]